MAKTKNEWIDGTSRQLLFSPKGGVEGALIERAGELLQLVLPPHLGSALAARLAPGKRFRAWARADTSPKSAEAEHPVYEFDSLTDAKGQAVEIAAGGSTMKGKVAQIHYARHGEANGVVLATGEFIHLRPHGMAALGLAVGAKVTARGELRMTVLGTRMLEAHSANGVEIE